MSKSKSVPLLLGLLLAAGAVLVAPGPAAALPAVSTGGPDLSTQKYHWVDSSAPGCTTTTTGMYDLGVIGCPSGWEDISSYGYSWVCGAGSWSSGDGYCPVGWWYYPYLNFNYYGNANGIMGSSWMDQYLAPNSNGFIRIGYPSACCAGSPGVEGTPVALPSTTAPAQIIAGYWTDMDANLVGTGVCSGDTAGTKGMVSGPSGFYFYPVWGPGSNVHWIFQWNNILVTTTHPTGSSTSAAYKSAICAAPHAYATFQIKLFGGYYSSTGPDYADVVIYSADNNGQPVSMGIQDPTRTYGLNYNLDATEVISSPRAVRYYFNHAPTAWVSTSSIYANEDTPYSWNLYASDNDYGDTMTATFPTPPDSTKAGLTLTGTSTSGSTTTFTYNYQGKPNINFPYGGDSFKWKVADSGGASTTGTVTTAINWINDPPTGVAKSYTVDANDLLWAAPDIGLLVGATDVEVPPLRLSTEQQALQTLQAVMATATAPASPAGCRLPASTPTSGPGSPLYYEDNGNVAISAYDGSFTYTPNAAAMAGTFPKSDSFYYCVWDGASGGYSPAYRVDLTIKVTNRYVIAKFDPRTLNEDTTLAGVGALRSAVNDVVAANATGVTYALVSSPTNAASFSFNPDGTFSYLPAIDWNGNDGFRYEIRTTNLGTSNVAAVRLQVAPINDPPVFTMPKYAPEVTEDVAYAGYPMITGTAPARSTALDELSGPTAQSVWTYSIFSNSNPSLFTTGIGYGCPGGAGCAGILPSMSWTSPTTATLYYRPALNRNGVADICVTATDTGSGVAPNVNVSPPQCFRLNVTAVNDAPLTKPDTFTIYRNHPLVSPWGTTPSILANDMEVDGENMTAMKVTDPAGTGKLTWGVNNEGDFRYQPPKDFIGTTSFTYQVWDESGKSSAVTPVTIIVKDNKLPKADFVINGQPYSMLGTATQDKDADGILDGVDNCPRTSNVRQEDWDHDKVGDACSAFLSANVGDEMIFAHACTDSDGTVVKWDWDFGDGTGTTAASTMHAFAQAGYYQVRLTCTDDVGDSATAVRNVTIRFPAEMVPTASVQESLALLVAYAGDNQNVNEGDIVHLHATANGAGDPGHYVYTWKQVVGGAIVDDASMVGPDITFRAPTYSGRGPLAVVFQVVVTDGMSTSLPDLVQVNVASTNRLPELKLGEDQRIVQGDTALLVAELKDADDDPLDYAWLQIGGAPVDLVDADKTTASFQVPPFDGTPLVFQFVATDGSGQVSAVTHVLALPPDITALGFTYNIAQSTSNGADVRFTSNIDGQTYVWDFGDGSEGSTDAAPQHTYAHPGTYTVKLSVIDKAGQAQAYTKPIAVSLADKARPVSAAQDSHTGAPAWLLPISLAGTLAVAGIAATVVWAARRRKA